MAGTLAADTVVYRISAVRNVSLADVNISVFDDSYMGPATAEDCAVARSVAVDCNSAVGYVPRPVEMVITAADCWTKGRVDAARRPEMLQRKYVM